MKKQFYLLTAGLLIVCITNAQIKKGDVLLGGNLNFSKQTTKPDDVFYNGDQTSFSISPSIAKAVKDDLIVGLNLSFSYFKNVNKVNTPSMISTSSSYGLGVFIRKYKVLGAGFALFAEGDLSGQDILSRSYADGGTKPPADKNYTINAGFYPGLAYFISKHVQLETGFQNLAYVQYGHANTGQNPFEVKTNTFSVGTGFNQALSNFIVGIKWLM